MDLQTYVAGLALEPGISFFGRPITLEDAQYFDSYGVCRETASALLQQLTDQGLVPVPGMAWPQIKDGIATMDYDYSGPGLPLATPWSVNSKTCFILKGFVQTSADLMEQGASSTGQVIVPKGTVFPVNENLGSVRCRGECIINSAGGAGGLSGADKNRIPPTDPSQGFTVEPTRLVWAITPDALYAYWAAPGQ